MQLLEIADKASLQLLQGQGDVRRRQGRRRSITQMSVSHTTLEGAGSAAFAAVTLASNSSGWVKSGQDNDETDGGDNAQLEEDSADAGGDSGTLDGQVTMG